jgi:hypothetical protein
MKSDNIIKLLDKEREWFSVSESENLGNKISIYIERKIRKSFMFLRLFKLVSLVSCCIMTVMLIFFISYQLKPAKVVFVYPNSGSEKSVNLVGTINKEKKKIPLVLDRNSGYWKATVRVAQNDIQDYHFIVEQFSDDEINNN